MRSCGTKTHKVFDHRKVEKTTPNFLRNPELRRAGPTHKPRHASVFSTHSDTQAVPAFHCIRLCLKASFRHASVFKKHRHTIHHCLKEVQKTFRHAMFLGNGGITVSRVLFRKRELTEFCGKLGEFCQKVGEFALTHKIKG